MFRLTFLSWDRKEGCLVNHYVTSIHLSTGDQGIPNGFLLTARCGEEKDELSIDLDPERCDAHDCEACATHRKDDK